ncbi:MAG: hypothetical protein ACRCZB_03510 [Bacteroidales bacterium]
MAYPVLYIDGEALEMGELNGIEIERSNPLLSSVQKSYSLPFTLPRTAHNDRLLNYPTRYARATKARKSFKCTMICGAIVRVGSLILNSTGTTYDCSMTYDTADLLGDLKEKKLAELTGWKAINYGSPEAAFNYLNQLRNGEVSNSEISIFKLTIDLKDIDGGFEVIMNNNNGVSLLPAKYDLDGNQIIEALPYFGIAPFLMAETILRFIFEEKRGYTLDFTTRQVEPLQQFAVLHNNMDVILNGYVQYKHLLPDVTVDTFISNLEKLLCGKFVLNSKTKIVSLVLWNDYLDYEDRRPPLEDIWNPYPNTKPYNAYKTPILDLKPYSLDRESIESLEKKSIKLSMKQDVDYNNFGGPHLFSNTTFAEYFTEDIEEEFMPLRGFGMHFRKVEELDYGTMYSYQIMAQTSRIDTSSNCWNYYRAIEGGASEDMEMDMQHVPCLLSMISYLFGTKYVNSKMTNKEDKSVKTPMALVTPFVYIRRIAATSIGTFDYPAAPRRMSLRLHRPDGIFNVFHAMRDAMLRSGGYRIKVRIDPKIEINEMELYLYNGQPVMIESVKEKLGANPQTEVTMQTIKLYE